MKCKKRFSCYALVALICLFPHVTPAQSSGGLRVIDESAIAYMEFLSKAEFDQRFPGQIKWELSDLESGWYVIYRHEQLNYYFGPILLQSTGEDYRIQLTQIVEAAVEQRPDIQDYELKLSYEPSTGFSGNSGNSGDSTSDSSSGDTGDEQQPGNASQPSGFWTFIRRIFGL